MNKQKRKRRQTSRYLLMGGIAGAVAITLLVLMIIPMQQRIPGDFLPTAQYLEANPGENPDFLRHWQQDEWLAIEIRGAALWEADDMYLTHAMLAQRLKIFINGSVIADEHLQYDTGEQGTALFTEVLYDAAGQEIGHADDLNVYVNMADMAGGLHIAEVEISTASGNIHTHQWAFRIGDVREVVYPTLAVIPTELTPTP
ncbi:MAG: hypothetical protein ACPG7F_17065 [Aggregatilineales bacterium]